MKLEVGKFYKSRDGRKWKCVHEFDIYAYGSPSHMCVEYNNNNVSTFFGNGSYHANGVQNRDLIAEWVEPIEHTVTVYFHKQVFSGAVVARESRVPVAGWTNIAKKTITFTEGDGL